MYYIFGLVTFEGANDKPETVHAIFLEFITIFGMVDQKGGGGD
jgi:hypothetical protein